MSPSPSLPPDDHNKEKADPSSSERPYESDQLAEVSAKGIRVSPDLLRVLSVNELHHVLDGALNNLESLNVFIDSARALCEDPDPAIDTFREQLCATLAEKIKSLCAEDTIDARPTLGKLLAVSDIVVDAFNSNPNPTKPLHINTLMTAHIHVVMDLDLDRGSLNELHTLSERNVSSEEAIRGWLNLYLSSFSQLMQCLTMEDFTPSAKVVTECTELLNTQLEWQRNGRGPLQSENYAELEVWAAVLSFATLLADEAFEPEILQIAADLVQGQQPSKDSSDNILELDGDSSSNEERLHLANLLDVCEQRAMHALLECQWSCKAASVWETVLHKNPLASGQTRLALVGLARTDGSRTPPHLGRLLNSLGSKTCSSKKAGVLMEMLETFLDNPGAGEVFINAFEHDAEHGVEPERRDVLLERIKNRLSFHYKYEEKARAALAMAGDDKDRCWKIRRKADLKGVIWSQRVLLPLEHVVQ